jgi:pyruvate formate lyase activating enzyme
MYAGWAVYEKLLPLLDLVMLDIKLSCDESHTQWTGIGNGLLLENIRRLAGTGIPIIVRTPVIPGVNDNAEEIGRIAGIVGELENVLYYELLMYNPLGESKYSALGIENKFTGTSPIGAERQETLRKAAEKSGVSCRIG